MSIGPLGGLPTSAAGSPLAQNSGPEADRATQDASAEHRKIDGQQKASDAAGVGRTDGENHETDQRDADGRRPGQRTPGGPDATGVEDQSSPGSSEDALEGRGTRLDLSG